MQGNFYICPTHRHATVIHVVLADCGPLRNAEGMILTDAGYEKYNIYSARSYSFRILQRPVSYLQHCVEGENQRVLHVSLLHAYEYLYKIILATGKLTMVYRTLNSSDDTR